MRAVFTFNLPNLNGSFPDDSEIIEVFRSFGWEPIDVQKLGTDVEAKKQIYQELAVKLFKSLIEQNNLREIEHLIFYGYLADEQATFLVDRVVEGQITFRVEHPNLPRLQNSVNRIIKMLMQSSIKNEHFRVSNGKIQIFIPPHADAVLKGRVITSPLRETLRSNRVNFILSYISLVLFILFTYAGFNSSQFFGRDFLDLLTPSLPLLLTAIIGFINFAQTFIENTREGLIVWSLVGDAAIEANSLK